ncbi:hypothetical protein [Fusibacter sp. 3D3]|uniref:hypothetical protein n=1 Tax=Fusibacter sp. 3D3 TaxID=1048380 RepID=UPI000853B611|nr:hypothetical protein [Fusibacter sp. 3D3]GAU79681.1 hypothetical protein F3D3_4345 [Fusibacter sp. 3D3]
MKKIFYVMVLFITTCVLSSCTSEQANRFKSEPANPFKLLETPQVYVLKDEDPFRIMPTVTLYENGNAQLSQPPISSFALFTMGQYEINENELMVTHGENTRASFEVSNNGDTLTLKSSTLGFTKVGAVYNYRSNADYLSQYPKIEGETLTVDALRELVKKAPYLTVSDFEKYTHFDIDTDYHIFNVDGGYTLKVIVSSDGNTGCIVERNSDGKSFPMNLNGSTNLSFDVYLGLANPSKYEPQKWLDYFKDEELPWGEIKELTLPEFPGITFTWSSEKVTAGDKVLFQGMPVWNVYLTDLTNDGKPEFCATVSFGSGIVDTHIIVYDYATDKVYPLADRTHYDYYLSMDEGEISVTQTEYMHEKPLVSAKLQLINGEIFRFGQSVEETQ